MICQTTYPAFVARSKPLSRMAVPIRGAHFFECPLGAIIEKHPGLARSAKRAVRHLGTLGTGNHFIEVCLDENNSVWLMLHSGSRGGGNRIGSYLIELPQEDM